MNMYVQFTWSHDLTRVGSDNCEDRKWREDMKRQLDATQTVLKQYAMKIVELEEKISNSNKKIKLYIQSHDYMHMYKGPSKSSVMNGFTYERNG